MRATAIRVENYAAYETTAALAHVARTAGKVALFVAAPFIGLAYAVALPFVGIGALVWIAVRAARK